MFVLILNNTDSLGYEIGKFLINKHEDLNIDILTEKTCNNLFLHNKFNIIKSSRRELKGIRDYYDVIIDLSAVLYNDIERLFEKIQFDKYILKSTYQVYNFIESNIILSEDSVDEEYFDSVLDIYLNPHNQQSRIYAREKMKCEFTLIEQSNRVGTKYVILRPSKVYSYEDNYSDISWILARLNNNCPFIFRDSDLIKNNLFNPVYVKDVAIAVSNLIQSHSATNSVFNIAQDHIISIFDLIENLANINSKSYQYYILDKLHFEKMELSNYKAPIPHSRILSNDRIKKAVSIEFDSTFNWLTDINSNIVMKEDARVSNFASEKNYIRSYMGYYKVLNSFRLLQ